jgi:carbonic anhydrase/acetyltransferase-like protein (isoleucine patch superfamily)
VIYVAPTAAIVGDVAIGKGSSVWHGAVLRGDLDRVVVGEHCSVQDNAVVHVDKGSPTLIGDRVTIGHGAVVHGCTIGADCLIGMNSTISSMANIGRGSIVAAGAVVPERGAFPPNSLIMGTPARHAGEVGDRHRRRIDLAWRIYVELAAATLPAAAEMQGNPSKRVRIGSADEFEKLSSIPDEPNLIALGPGRPERDRGGPSRRSSGTRGGKTPSRRGDAPPVRAKSRRR